MSGLRRTAMICVLLGLIAIPGCLASQGGYGYEPGYGYEGGPTPDGRRYSRAFVQQEWIGASQGEVLDHWGEPYQRSYWDYEEVGNRTYGYGPYMAYVEVVRDPYNGRPGEVEHIYFILDQDFRQVTRVEFSEPQPWWGGDVEVMILDEW